MAIWTSETDLDAEQDSTGGVHDGLYDHPGSGTLAQGYYYGSLTRGLLAYYPMEFVDNDGTVLYDAALNNHGTINGASRTSGKVGDDALSFDGTDDRVLTGLNLATDEPHTISLWCQATADVDRFPIGDYESTSSGFYIWVRPGTDVRYTIRHTGDGTESTNGYTPSVDEWLHIVGVYDGNDMRLYVNDSLIDTNTPTNTLSNTSQEVEIGDKGDGSGWFSGNIDDVRIYDRPLNSEEISALYNLTSPSGSVQTTDPTDNLVSEYLLNGDATDNVGSNDGTVNGPTFSTSSGRRNQGASFDGTDDYIDIDSSAYDVGDGGSFTTSIWVKAGSTSRTTVYAFRGSSSLVFMKANEDSGANVSANSVSAFFRDDSNTSTRIAGSVTDITDWHNFVQVFDGSSDNQYLYLDGEIAASDSTALGAFTFTNNEIGADNDGTSGPFDGDIDDVRFYDRALTPLEIEQLYYHDLYRVPRRAVVA